MSGENSSGASARIESGAPGTDAGNLPKEVTGKEAAPTTRRRLGWGRLVWLALAEYAVYFIVAAMLLVALWVNLIVAYFGGGTELLQRFAADGEFILAASAVLLFAFEIRKERRAPR